MDKGSKDYITLFERLGDPSQADEALRAIFVLCRRDFMRYIRKFIPHDRGAVKDLFEDLMVFICENAQDVAMRENPKSWLFGVVKNKVKAYLRHTRRMPTDDINDHLDLVGGLLPDEEAEARELEQWIQKAAEGLTPKRREAFLLRWTEGLTKEEIAQRMGSSPHTVKKQLAEAIQQVGEVLKSRLGYK